MGTSRAAAVGLQGRPLSAHVPFACPACGPRVETVASAEVTCSCGRRCTPAFTDLRPGFTPKARLCVWCGVGLDGKRAKAKYCSTSHRVLAYRKRKLEAA
jgi:hypothetical protein